MWVQFQTEIKSPGNVTPAKAFAFYIYSELLGMALGILLGIFFSNCRIFSTSVENTLHP